MTPAACPRVLRFPAPWEWIVHPATPLACKRVFMKMSIALACFVIGIALLIVGLNSSDSIRDAFSRLFNGHFTDRTMWVIVGGSVCLIV
ncbi:MAG TPA: DUF3185 family protein, partial [Planctomycetota bacterium]|nr:DUF3185 family protein [Planctomycetota bacterium]